MRTDENIRLDFIWDHENGRRVQLIFVNKDRNNPMFTIHNDTLGRQYTKLKLNQEDIMTLIQELKKGLIVNENNVNSFNKDLAKQNLTIISNNNVED